MISKEERAELRELVASVTLPLPWKSDSDGVIVSDLYDFVADCDGTGGDFIDPKPAKLIAGAVNAAPKLLDALDAADERIAGLEAAAQWRPMDTVPTDGTHVVVYMGFRDGAPHFETRRYIAPPLRQTRALLGRSTSTHWRWLPIPALPKGGV